MSYGSVQTVISGHTLIANNQGSVQRASKWSRTNPTGPHKSRPSSKVWKMSHGSAKRRQIHSQPDKRFTIIASACSKVFLQPRTSQKEKQHSHQESRLTQEGSKQSRFSPQEERSSKSSKRPLKTAVTLSSNSGCLSAFCSLENLSSWIHHRITSATFWVCLSKD